MKKTKVICTIGPVSNNLKVMKQMALNGMNCVRINLSHAKPESILETIEVVRKVRNETNLPIAIMYDTKGPEFRLLEIDNGGFKVKKDQTLKIIKNKVLGNKGQISVNHPEAIDHIKVGDHVLIDNALLDMEVIEKKENHIVVKALNNGEIKSHKTINVPGVDLNLAFVSEVDREDITFAAQHSCDYLALSFVETKKDVLEAKKIIEKAGGDARIISKIESQQGIDNIDEIIEVSDGIMVARGDLGVEVPLEHLPILQKTIIHKCRENGKFAIVATEMLASMYENPRPTRAEVSDIANAVIDGTDCVMLSGETTVGKYPTEAVEIMSKICEYIESTIDYTKHTDYKRKIEVSDIVAKLVNDAVDYEKVKLIVTATMTGYTARKISNLRPNCAILACCPSNHIAEKVALNFGVEPITVDLFDNMEDIVDVAKKMAKELYQLKEGDLIVVTGGFPLGKSRSTNLIRIVEL
jgi:pyruvate kinase